MIEQVKKSSPAKKRDIRMGFDEETVTLEIDKIISLKVVSDRVRESRKYQQIIASIKEVGIIEPPIVAPSSQVKGRYMLLDGHMRVDILKSLSQTEVVCLVSTDDESFTYNKHINHLSPIQEHRMILNAVKRGVPEEKIAQALDVDVSNIIRKKSLLDGICPEAIDLLKDKMVAGGVFYLLKKMSAVRQVEAATLMNDAGIYSTPYAKALLAATPRDQLTNPDKPKNIKGLSEEQMSRMENEMATLQREYRLIEENYGADVLNLTFARSYVANLVSNARISKYLGQHHPEILTQFQKISAMKNLE